MIYNRIPRDPESSSGWDDRLLGQPHFHTLQEPHQEAGRLLETVLHDENGHKLPKFF